MARLTRVFTFPPGRPFADALAAWLLDEYGEEPLHLSRVLLLLPSRRACLSMRDALLRQSGGVPLLLPRLQPLGDAEDVAGTDGWMDDMDLPPAISPSLRQVLLTLLVHRANVGLSKEHAALLAQELAVLLDNMARKEVGFEGLDSLVPSELSAHWQRTVDFLRILRHDWPRALADEKKIDAIPRRNALLRTLAMQWEENPPPHPVIAAGSTGSMPATAALLRCIAGLPDGRVVLPGLDVNMPKEAWEALTPTHPQWGLKQLLNTLGIERSDVTQLAEEESPRAALISLAMEPGLRRQEHLRGALTGLEYAECETLHEEARTIALRLRHALEVPGRTAALVTPDRHLARMVAAHLRRFDLEVNDSAGRPALRTPPGVFLQQVAEMAATNAAPLSLLAVLKHPLCTAGMTPAACREAARMLELQALRGVRPRAGLSGMFHLASSEALVLLKAVERVAGDFMRCMQQAAAPLDALLQLHMRAAETLSDGRIWQGEDGAGLAEALAELRLCAERLGDISPREYPGLFDVLLQSLTVRATYGTHPRLSILSPMEARMQHFDIMVLGGLNEGSWPAEPSVSPWMSRPMAAAFGLPPAEEETGKSAHDFCMLVCAPAALLTRARRVEGAVTVPSRWLVRLQAQLAPEALPVSPYLAWGRAETAVAAVFPCPQPKPTPPVQARPLRLSVTEIETWQRDPYAIYARHVLRLKRLDALDQEPDLREFGQAVHATLDRFAKKFPSALPKDAEAQLEACAEEVLARLADRPAVAAFWQPRMKAMIPWLAAQERERRVADTQLLAECAGEWEVGGLTLSTRIDRLEVHADGGVSLVDYKTGTLPTEKDIKTALCPQLPLEALVVLQGTLTLATGQEAPHADNVRSLSYWKLAGAANEAKDLKDIPSLLAAAEEILRTLIADFSRQEMPYIACPDPDIAPRYNDYRHLERVEEWQSATGDEEEAVG